MLTCLDCLPGPPLLHQQRGPARGGSQGGSFISADIDRKQLKSRTLINSSPLSSASAFTTWVGDFLVIVLNCVCVWCLIKSKMGMRCTNRCSPCRSRCAWRGRWARPPAPPPPSCCPRPRWSPAWRTPLVTLHQQHFHSGRSEPNDHIKIQYIRGKLGGGENKDNVGNRAMAGTKLFE